jgi:hypothetical protein
LAVRRAGASCSAPGRKGARDTKLLRLHCTALHATLRGCC